MPEPGQTVERYVIQRPLGKGGLALVYLVTDKDSGRPFALKILAPADPRVDAGLGHLGRMLARLQHPNVVHLHDVIDVRGHPGLLVDYVDGTSLSDHLSHGPLDTDDAEFLVRAVVDGLAHLHASGVVHRDLKPGNVLLEPRGAEVVPRLSDAGLAGVLSDALGANAVRLGVLPGTPRYLAPEQLWGESVDVRADIWALGALLYEVLSGRPPYRGADPIALRHAMGQREHVPLDHVVPGAPAGMVRAVEGALVPDRDERIPHVAAFLEVMGGAGWALPSMLEVLDADPAPDELRAGAVLGERVRLNTLIGYDDLSETWRGIDFADDAPVVVRALLRGTDAIARSRFEAAAASLRAVEHPSVPRIRPSLVVERAVPVFALVRDWIPGRSLADEAAALRPEAGEVLATLADLLEVIGHLHAHDPPVIHRNLHPGNVIRADDGRLVVVDFGGPRAALTDPAHQSYALVGQFGFMAPEQLSGSATLGSDVYAAAAIAVSLLTRRHPRTLLDDEGRLAWTAHTTVDPAVRDLLQRMLADDPDARPYAVRAAKQVRALVVGNIEDVDELAAPLPPLPGDDEPTDPRIPIQRTTGSGSTVPPILDLPTDPGLHPSDGRRVRHPPAREEPDRTRWLVAVAALVLVLLILAAAWTLWPDATPDEPEAPVEAPAKE